MSLLKGSIILQLLLVISVSCRTASMEYTKDIDKFKDKLKNCPTECSNTTDLNCQCLQIEDVKNCSAAYFISGVDKLKTRLKVESVHASNLFTRVKVWSDITNEDLNKLDPKCDPLVPPLKFLKELNRLFQGLNALGLMHKK